MTAKRRGASGLGGMTADNLAPLRSAQLDNKTDKGHFVAEFSEVQFNANEFVETSRLHCT